MEIIICNEGIIPELNRACIALAVSEAPSMVHQVIGFDSPILPLAQAEVEIILGDSLLAIGAGGREEFEGVWCDLEAGVVAAIDTDGPMRRFAGFIQYKRRLLADGTATIGYAAVSKDYRGQGVFKLMLDELKRLYPVLGLDCPLELVPMYERLGFKVSTAMATHVGMCTAPLTGMSWTRGQDFLVGDYRYQEAKREIQTALGSATALAYAKCAADTQKRALEVKALLAQHGIAT